MDADGGNAADGAAPSSEGAADGAAAARAAAHLPFPGPPQRPKRAEGRSLGDFRLDGATTPNGLHPAEEKLLAAVAKGEGCDLRVEMPRPIREQIEIVRDALLRRGNLSDADKKKIGETDGPALSVIATLPPDSWVRWSPGVCFEQPSRRVRAAFLRFLALGGDADAPVHDKGLRLAGAYIEGELDLEGCRDVVGLGLGQCWCDGAVVVRDAQLRGLYLGGSRVPGLQGDGVRVDGSVLLRQGFVADGEVRLPGADIGGQFACDGGTFRNRTDDGTGVALEFSTAKVGGEVFLSGGFVAEGAVRLLGADIGGVLDCSGGTFRNRTADGTGAALGCDGVKVGGGVYLREGFVAEGAVQLLGADIGGSLACVGGTFDNAVERPPDPTNSGQGPFAAIALQLSNATIKGTTFLGPAAPPGDKPVTMRGSVDLQGARLTDLIDHPDSWPPPAVTAPDGTTQLACTIALDGLTYARLSGGGRYDAETRKRWLARQSYNHRITEFRPQPYEQLVKVLREMGHEADARAIAKARQAAWRKAALVNLWAEARGAWRHPRRLVTIPVRTLWQLGAWAAIGGLAGYGYGKKRLLAMAVLVGLGCAQIYQAAGEQGQMAPSHPVVFTNETLRARCGANWTECAALPREHAAFSPHLYSFDVLLPIISLGVDGAWSPVYEAPDAAREVKGSAVTLRAAPWVPFAERLPVIELPHWGLRFVYWGEIVAGWALSLLIVAVFSGVMKKD